MRPQILTLLILLSCVLLACAWTKDDHEIFRLRDEVEASEGTDVTFYDFLGIKPSATYEDIQKAFRKKSRALHPDKVKHSFIASQSTAKPKSKPGQKKQPGVHVSKGPSQRELQKFTKQATERYGRLGVVTDILKGESRARYDHFLKNGFPKWRGTGYYYTRFRPGLGSVLTGLFIAGGGFAHYGALVLSWKRQRDFVDRYVRHARKAAWGDETGIRGIPGLSGSPTSYVPPAPSEEPDPAANLNRRQKREMERQNKKESKVGKISKKADAPAPTVATTPSGQKKRVVAENGKILVVDSIGNVFLEEEDEEGNVDEYLLDVNEIPKPTYRDTAVYRLPVWLYQKATEPFLKRTHLVPSELGQEKAQVPAVETEMTLEQDSSQDSTEGFEMIDSTGLENEIGQVKKRGKKGKK